ncbi:hypothetical protein BDV96DRAFT_337169 [Lophiotrema nucula]|uniref:Azaphilone pigments biosynthesis cluster protein L N-terminal domain-containing protein n=1 Tax=Lophiotrema nucula TaxID=690887 RepID=A0A6A5YHI8_9PLEO|nr:hypothetical protein BDV96DRAFT_337169 [Lophiotrema nucula]
MDPLSITASVIAILQLSGKIISSCVAYTSAIKDAPKELKAISVDIQSLQAIIRILDLTSANATADNGLATSLDACRQSLKALSDLLDHQINLSSPQNGPSAKKARTMPTLATLAWPLKRSRVQALIDDISRHKSTITLSLSTSLSYNPDH